MNSRLLWVWVALLVCVILFAACGDDDDDDDDAAAGPIVRHVVIKSDTPVAHVDEKFLSFAVDSGQVVGSTFWSPDGQVEIGVGENRVDSYDFSRKKLRAMAKHLAPAYVRIGGSDADKIFYNLSEFPGPDPEAPGEYEFVMTREMIDGIADFANDLGFEIFFTVNAGPGPRGENGAWTPDNAWALMAYTTANNIPVGVWELGNEVSAFPLTHGVFNGVSPEQYAADLGELHTLVELMDPGTLVAGPSSAYWPMAGEMFPGFMGPFMEAGGPILDVLTWHYYPQQSQRCPVATRRASQEWALLPPLLDEIDGWADEVQTLRDVYAPAAQVWLGETARRGQRIVVRQNLSGSDYGMIDEGTLTPNPDYWNAVLWKRLMGTAVLATGLVETDALARTFAHCTPGRPGGVTVLLMNLRRDRNVRFHLDDLSGEAKLYRLTSPEPLSKEVILNGAVLSVDGSGEIPALPAARTGSPVTLAPISYAFAVFEDAGVAACR